MYIVPNSTVYILSGISINKNYQHTIYFDDANAQYNYFKKHVKKTFTGVSYQREKRGWMRVECSADELYNCNYIMYQNTAYNNKWFYAFIDSVEFVNSVTCEVTFTLDVMQTWFFDYTLQACFVDREHVADDTVFKHTVPENIGYGEIVPTLVANKVSDDATDIFSAKGIIYAASEAPSTSGNNSAQTTAYGMPCNMHVRCSAYNVGDDFKITSITTGVMMDLQRYMTDGKQSAIQSVYTCPLFMCDKVSSISILKEGSLPPETVAEAEVSVLAKVDGALNGYTPRNKKLYTYPYNYLRITNNSGDMREYRYEDFNKIEGVIQPIVKFKVYGTGFNNPQVTILPMNYKNQKELYTEGLTITGYPPVPFLGDVLAAYLALNSNQIAFGYHDIAQKAFVGGVLNTINNVNDGAISVGLGLINNVGSGLLSQHSYEEAQQAKQADLDNTPNTVQGLANATSTAAASDNLRPIAYQMCVKAEYAKIIDGYFDRWGYKCNEVKIPNRNVRPHWTYTKTNACTINANCPGDDEDMICNIYNNGITFWRNGDEVGNYTLDNSI